MDFGITESVLKQEFVISNVVRNLKISILKASSYTFYQTTEYTAFIGLSKTGFTG